MEKYIQRTMKMLSMVSCDLRVRMSQDFLRCGFLGLISILIRPMCG